jgi:homopolymeric O-antigen transport system permease protein
VIRFRFLLKELVERDLKVRYAGSLFGFVWAFVNPLWQLALYSIVFSAILRMPLEGEATQSFPLFLFAGLLPWMGFSEGINRGTTCVVMNGELVKKHAFPGELLVAAVTLSAFIHEAIALALFVVVRSVQGGLVWQHLPAMLLGAVLQLLITYGLGLLLATAQVYLRDIQHGLGLVLQALFYLTPLIYPIALVPERLTWAVDINPLSTIVTLHRAFLIGSKLPDTIAILLSIVVAGISVAVGTVVFRRSAPGFADEL